MSSDSYILFPKERFVQPHIIFSEDVLENIFVNTPKIQMKKQNKARN